MVAMIPPLPDILPPDADSLPTLLAEILTNHDLLIIAEADYEHNVEAHLSALRRLIREGTSTPLEWRPREVLELTRWAGPPRDPIYERAHWRCAFSCVALLRAYGEAANHDTLYGQNQSLIILIDSLRLLTTFPLPRPKRVLLADLDRPAAAFLVWLIPHLPIDDGEHAFFGLGLLWFALAINVPDAALVALADWIMIAEDAAAAPWRELGMEPSSNRWLLGNTVFAQRDWLWQTFGMWLPDRLRAHHGPEVSEAIRLVAAMLVPSL